jgi:hypothetical protein
LRKIEPLTKKLLSKTSRSSASKRRLTDEAAIRQFLDGIPDGSDASGDEEDDNEDDVDNPGQDDVLDEVVLLNMREAGIDRYRYRMVVMEGQYRYVKKRNAIKLCFN